MITSSLTALIAVVVLKQETSTLRQRHNCLSIDFKFGVGDYVREVTSPVKFGSDPMSGRATTWGPIPVNQFSRTIAQKTRSGVRKTLLGMRNV